QEPGERYSTVVDFGRDVVAASAELRDTDRTVRIASVRPMRLSEPTQRVVPPTPASIRKLQPRAKPNRAALGAASVLLIALAAAGGAYVATRTRSGTEAGLGDRRRDSTYTDGSGDEHVQAGRSCRNPSGFAVGAAISAAGGAAGEAARHPVDATAVHGPVTFGSVHYATVVSGD